MDAKSVNGWIVILFLVIATTSGCALQEDVARVNRRITGVEQRQNQKVEASVATLRSEIARYYEEQKKSGQDCRNRYAELHTQVNELRSDMQRLHGQLDEIWHNTGQKIDFLDESRGGRDKQLQSIEKSLQGSLDRIVRLEQYLGMEPSEKLPSSQPETGSLEKGEPEARKTPEELYVKAKQQFDQGEYEDARELFQTFLKRYPKSKRADNAQFWIGEVYYREKWYEKAILEYQKVIESYPEGNKVCSALLKQGFAFLNLGDKDNARLILKELVRKYSDSNEAKIAREKLKKIQ